MAVLAKPFRSEGSLAGRAWLPGEEAEEHRRCDGLRAVSGPNHVEGDRGHRPLGCAVMDTEWTQEHQILPDLHR